MSGRASARILVLVETTMTFLRGVRERLGRSAGRLRWGLGEARRVATEGGPPILVQALRFLSYALRTETDVAEFYQSRLWTAHRPAREVLSWRRWYRAERRFNPPPFRALAGHKYFAHRLLEAAGVPRPRFLGLLHADFGFTAADEPLRTASDLARLLERPGVQPVFKPAAGHKGKGIVIGRGWEDGRLLTLDGRSFTPDQLYAQLLTGSAEWLVEERVRPHPFFARYAEGTSKVRLVTLRRGDRVDVIAAGLSIAVSGQAAVNNDSGAFLTGVNLETGELTGAILLIDTRVRTHHPNGTPIVGERVPFWDDALDTARRAQLAIPWLRSLGWDIALDHAGTWRVLEGNLGWGVPAVQALSERGLLAGPLGTELRRVPRGRRR